MQKQRLIEPLLNSKSIGTQAVISQWNSNDTLHVLRGTLTSLHIYYLKGRYRCRWEGVELKVKGDQPAESIFQCYGHNVGAVPKFCYPKSQRGTISGYISRGREAKLIYSTCIHTNGKRTQNSVYCKNM